MISKSWYKMLPKIAELRSRYQERGLDLHIKVDGG